MKKIGMKLFKALNMVMVFTLLLSACCLDSESWMPAIICASAIAYLGCALYVCEIIAARKNR